MKEYLLIANYSGDRQIKLRIINYSKIANDSSPAMLAQVFGDELYIEYCARLDLANKKHPVDVACLSIDTTDLVSAEIHNIVYLSDGEEYPFITSVYPQ